MVLVFVGKDGVAGFPAFKLAVTPRNVNAEGNGGKHHDNQPLKEEAEACSVKAQTAAVYIGVAADPALLCAVRPGEEQTEGYNAQHRCPDAEPQITKTAAFKFKISFHKLFFTAFFLLTVC